jgi:hypothetical protein
MGVSKRVTAAELFGAIKAVLEWVLPADWYATAPADHPMKLYWDTCNQILSTEGIVRPDEFKAQGKIACHMVLDTAVLGSTSQEEDILKGEPLSHYGSAALRRKLRSMAKDPSQVGDIMTEIYTGVWYRLRGFDVTPFERPNYPDLQVEDTRHPLFIECKRVHSKKHWNWADNLRDAHRKLGYALARHPTGCCLVVLDVSQSVGLQDIEKESLPMPVVEVSQEVRDIITERALSSIHGVLVVWDEVMLCDDLGKGTYVALRRRSKLVHSGHQVDFHPVSVFEGYTIELWSKKRKQDGQEFLKEVHWSAVPRTHAWLKATYHSFADHLIR